MAEVYQALVLGTRDYVRKNGFSKVTLGLSGGVDSSLVAAIAVDALGAENVIGVSMPSRFSSDHSKSDAAELARRLDIRLETILIEPAYRAYLEMLADIFAETQPNEAEENLQSRARGNTLMALSNKFGWLVLTTGNKSEMAARARARRARRPCRLPAGASRCRAAVLLRLPSLPSLSEPAGDGKARRARSLTSAAGRIASMWPLSSRRRA